MKINLKTELIGNFDERCLNEIKERLRSHGLDALEVKLVAGRDPSKNRVEFTGSDENLKKLNRILSGLLDF